MEITIAVYNRNGKPLSNNVYADGKNLDLCRMVGGIVIPLN